MHFRNILRELSKTPSISEIVSFSPPAFYLPPSSVPFVLGAFKEASDHRAVLAVVPTRRQAQELYEELGEVIGFDQVRLLPAWETLPLERVSPSIETMGRRLRVINELTNLGPAEKLLVIAPLRAMVQLVGGTAVAAGSIELGKGVECDVEKLLTWLSVSGYRREYQVEHRGEFAVRGSIVDIFPSDADCPIRADFFGDEVERLAEFDPFDQLSQHEIETVRIYPARELIITDKVSEKASHLGKELGYAFEAWEKIANRELFDGIESWLPWVDEEAKTIGNYLSSDMRIILFEPSRLRARARELLEEERSIAEVLGSTWMVPDDHPPFPELFVDLESLIKDVPSPLSLAATVADPSIDHQVLAKGIELSSRDPAVITNYLGGLLSEGFRIVVSVANEAFARRMVGALAEGNLDSTWIENQLDLDKVLQSPRAGIFVAVLQLESGSVFPELKLAILGQGDLSNRRRSHRAPRAKIATKAQVFDALSVGGYVVHDHHGVGRFQGMVKRNIVGVERDYLLIEYRGNDRLYIPSDQMDSITPYLGGDTPTLSKLGGSDWQKTRARVRQAVNKIAQELVVLYQKRITTQGFAFSPDTVWQKEMEDLFPFELTPDQERAIKDVKSDMESDKPMDRLICGDVGFGKTEVAIRAVFKCVQDGKQAAVLVPTTLLAQQHYQTFSDRFSSFPVRVEMVSRFLTASEVKSVLDDLASGNVDVVIGTHRLLGSDVKFADLGLLVIDEEQHFGVGHKEAIKSIKAGIDVLTLSATPIPRTLEMSLTGIRDMSLLSTPPTQRQPILTYVGEYDERAVSEALRRELLREGQVFFVHNRISDIDNVAQRLSRLVPEARIRIAHGRMDEGTLEQTVIDFWEGRFDVLVCTTIIESGIDMPTVNTLVVDRADRMGLGQLHQLRGRVGRSGTRGYAYLFHPADIALTEDAYERLKTIGENTDLGSGFRIAMRDLEIRGAGNILGDNQSGHIAAVGYDLYVKMVEEAVRDLKGELIPRPAEIKLEIPVGAIIPESYITRTDLRMEAYKRLSICESTEEVDQVEKEWIDRFGPVPAASVTLLKLAKLRVRAIKANINEISVVGLGKSSLVNPAIRISPIELKASAAMRLRRLYPDAIYKDGERMLVIPISRGLEPLGTIDKVFSDLIES